MGARQHRHDRERQRQLAVVGAGKVISHGPIIRGVDALDQRKSGSLLRAPLGLEQVESEHDVGRGDRRSVRELRGRVEMEDDLVARRIGFDALGDEAVKRERLVGRARHQRLIDVADEALRRRQGLDVVRVQAVEGAEISEIERAALGGLRIDVRQVVEVGRQGRLAMHRNRARRRTKAAGDRRRARDCDNKGSAEEGTNYPADHRDLSIIGGRRIPNGRRSLWRVVAVGRFLPAADGRKDEIAIGILRRIWKEGRQSAARSRASRHVVAPEARRHQFGPLRFWRRAKRKPFSV